MARKDKYFKFNLLPGVSKEEKKLYAKRDSSILYSFMIVFGGILVYLVLSIIQLLIVGTRINYINSQINSINSEIANFADIKGINGELISKSFLLQEPLSEDIKINQFLLIADSLISNLGTVTSYDREQDGTFVLSVEFESIENIISVIENAKTSNLVEDIFIRNIITLGESEFQSEISFNIIKEESQTQ